MNKETQDLLPCPFCGGEEIEVSRVYINPLLPDSPPDEVYVGCIGCGIGYTEETEAEAIAAWSARVEPKCSTCRGEGRRSSDAGWPIDCPECGKGWPSASEPAGEFVKFINECKKNGTKWISVKWLWDARDTITRLEGEKEKDEKDCLQVISERDLAQDCLQSIDIALGGDGEWSNKYDCGEEALLKAKELTAALAAKEDVLYEIAHLCENCRSLCDAIYIAHGRKNTSTESGCEKCWVQEERDNNKQLRTALAAKEAECERHIGTLSFVQEAVTRAKAKCIHSCNCCGATANIEQALKDKDND